MGIVRLPSQQQPDNMKNPTSALTEEVTKQNVQPSRKATRIVLGVEVHLRSYQVARKVDNLAIGPVQSFRSQTELLLWLERLKARAEQIEVVYEAGHWVTPCIESSEPEASIAGYVRPIVVNKKGNASRPIRLMRGHWRAGSTVI